MRAIVAILSVILLLVVIVCSLALTPTRFFIGSVPQGWTGGAEMVLLKAGLLSGYKWEESAGTLFVQVPCVYRDKRTTFYVFYKAGAQWLYRRVDIGHTRLAQDERDFPLAFYLTAAHR